MSAKRSKRGYFSSFAGKILLLAAGLILLVALGSILAWALHSFSNAEKDRALGQQASGLAAEAYMRLEEGKTLKDWNPVPDLEDDIRLHRSGLFPGSDRNMPPRSTVNPWENRILRRIETAFIKHWEESGIAAPLPERSFSPLRPPMRSDRRRHEMEHTGREGGAQEGFRTYRDPHRVYLFTLTWPAYPEPDQRLQLVLRIEPRRPLVLLPIFIVLLLVGSGALVSAFWTYRRIARPLSRLHRATERFGRTRKMEPLDDKGASGELGQTIRAFNRMQLSLTQASEEQIALIASLSHDLRTVLTRLHLRLELMPKDSKEHEKLKKALESDISTMDQLLEENLDYARFHLQSESHKQKREEIDLYSLVQSLLDQEPGNWSKRFSWKEGKGNRLKVFANKSYLERAFRNLLDNARKYAKKAELSIKTEVRGKGAFALFELEDDGPGIPGNRRDHVLKAFTRLEDSRNRDTGGTGLGLVIAKDIAEAEGGSLELGDRPDGNPGLKVSLRLPLKREKRE